MSDPPLSPGECHQPACERAATETVTDLPCCADHAVLRRAGWRCEAIIPDPRPWKNNEPLRCVIVGSEIGVVNGQARCSRHREVANV